MTAIRGENKLKNMDKSEKNIRLFIADYVISSAKKKTHDQLLQQLLEEGMPDYIKMITLIELFARQIN